MLYFKMPNFLFACRILNIVNMWYYPQWIASMQLIYQVKNAIYSYANKHLTTCKKKKKKTKI